MKANVQVKLPISRRRLRDRQIEVRVLADQEAEIGSLRDAVENGMVAALYLDPKVALRIIPGKSS